MYVERETAYIPKNVRQMGEPSGERRIYVEDYVITYINRIFSGNKDREKVLLLFGGEMKEKGNRYLYIRGACQVEAKGAEHGENYFSGEDFQEAMEEGKKYFDNLALIGWALIRRGQPMSLEEKMRNTWEAYMSRIPIFLLGDSMEEEKIFYWKYDGRVKVQAGYYIFYEKNRQMQEYMIERNNRGKEAEEEKKPEEDVLIDHVREKLEQKKEEKRHIHRLLYAACAFLFLVILAIGVTLLNSNEKIEAIQTSVDSLLETLAANEILDREEEPTAKTAERELATKAAHETATTELMQPATTESSQLAPEPTQQATTEAAQSTLQQQSDATTQPTVTEPTEPSSQSQPETSAESTPASNKVITHVIKKGETLESISKSVYGNVSMVGAICEKNKIENPDAVFEGQEILLP